MSPPHGSTRARGPPPVRSAALTLLVLALASCAGPLLAPDPARQDLARGLEAGHARILARHLVPNILGTVLVYAALTVPQAVRQEALLSFIGLGVEPPAASLGSLLRDGLAALSPLRVEWWLLAFPVAALVL